VATKVESLFRKEKPITATLAKPFQNLADTLAAILAGTEGKLLWNCLRLIGAG
jgi:hypothetical protein